MGDRVAMPWLGYACGTCEFCVSGWETLCLEQKNMGYSMDGGLAEYAKAYARYAAGKTRVIREVRPLTEINEGIEDVEAGRVPARIVFEP